MVRQWWQVTAQGLVGTIIVPLAVSGLAGALSLLTHHRDQESCPCLRLSSPPSNLGVPIALSLL